LAEKEVEDHLLYKSLPINGNASNRKTVT